MGFDIELHEGKAQYQVLGITDERNKEIQALFSRVVDETDTPIEALVRAAKECETIQELVLISYVIGGYTHMLFSQAGEFDK